MRYPESLLSEGENVIFDVHHHPLVLAGSASLSLLFIIAWATLLFMVPLTRETWAVVSGLALLLILAAYTAWRFAVWSHVNLVLTNYRLVFVTGIFTRNSREIPLSKISDVSCRQTLPGRVFGMGDLTLETDAETGPLAFFNMPDPERLKLAIIDGARESGRGTGHSLLADEVARAVAMRQPTLEMRALPPERPPLYSEIVDQIERLDALKERGTITAEEFEKAKKALLDRLKGEG